MVLFKTMRLGNNQSSYAFCKMPTCRPHTQVSQSTDLSLPTLILSNLIFHQCIEPFCTYCHMCQFRCACYHAFVYGIYMNLILFKLFRVSRHTSQKLQHKCLTLPLLKHRRAQIHLMIKTKHVRVLTKATQSWHVMFSLGFR